AVVEGRVVHGDVSHRVVRGPEERGIRGQARDRGCPLITPGADSGRRARVARRAGVAVVAGRSRRRRVDAAGGRIAGIGGAGVVVVAVPREAAAAEPTADEGVGTSVTDRA